MLGEKHTYNHRSRSGHIEREREYYEGDVSDLLTEYLEGRGEFPAIKGLGSLWKLTVNGRLDQSGNSNIAITQCITPQTKSTEDKLDNLLPELRDLLESNKLGSVDTIVIPGIADQGRGFFGIVIKIDIENAANSKFMILDTSGSHELINWYGPIILKHFPDSKVTDSPEFKTFAFRGYGTTEETRFIIPGNVKDSCGPTTVRNILVAVHEPYQKAVGIKTDTQLDIPVDQPEKWRTNDARVINALEIRNGHADARLPEPALSDVTTWHGYHEWLEEVSSLSSAKYGRRTDTADKEEKSVLIRVLERETIGTATSQASRTDKSNDFYVDEAFAEIALVFEKTSMNLSIDIEERKNAFLDEISRESPEGGYVYKNAALATERFTRDYMGELTSSTTEAIKDTAEYIWNSLNESLLSLSQQISL